ncbi:MAG: hypothetical protein E3J72_07785 [Planctomycetota bacterium]|nr:MAG: hypothetical protein E3J72_07785 [Planctomycetota bacterium]
MTFAQFLLSLLLLCALVTSAYGQDFPQSGKINVSEDKVANVRSGPDLDYKAIGQLKRGRIVTVLAQEGKWYKIRIPEEIPLYIPQRYVEVRETDKSGNKVGKVTHNRVDLRSGTTPLDKSLGKAFEDDRVIITGSKQSWYIIRGHKRAAAYISTRHVQLLKTARAKPVPIKPTKPPKKVERAKPRATQKTPQDDAEFRRRLDSALDRKDLDEVRRILDQWVAASRRAPEPEQPTREKLISEYRARLEAARKELEKAKEPPAPVKEYIGRIDDVGLLLFPPPGGFKLLKGDEIVYYLKSGKPATIKLGKYLFRRVVITGKVDKIKGWETPLIRVTSIRLLDEEETPSDGDDESNSETSDK